MSFFELIGLVVVAFFCAVAWNEIRNHSDD